ncbi:hypothetical protein [[Mycoplasma] gypis]|uniref:DUF31 domain-containing protein n=1 Tax=[Mycoplasma] gypis TaxID=92404 RepID=A0ABZ2RMG3_9BACT|nr:hypothetical protein [[Mycoplasma] gypis]MBN0919067.1 hypothetical protein [[Mycoplasma] gypis]
MEVTSNFFDEINDEKLKATTHDYGNFVISDLLIEDFSNLETLWFYKTNEKGERYIDIFRATANNGAYNADYQTVKDSLTKQLKIYLLKAVNDKEKQYWAEINKHFANVLESERNFWIYNLPLVNFATQVKLLTNSGDASEMKQLDYFISNTKLDKNNYEIIKDYDSFKKIDKGFLIELFCSNITIYRFLSKVFSIPEEELFWYNKSQIIELANKISEFKNESYFLEKEINKFIKLIEIIFDNQSNNNSYDDTVELKREYKRPVNEFENKTKQLKSSFTKTIVMASIFLVLLIALPIVASVIINKNIININWEYKNYIPLMVAGLIFILMSIFVGISNAKTFSLNKDLRKMLSNDKLETIEEKYKTQEVLKDKKILLNVLKDKKINNLIKIALIIIAVFGFIGSLFKLPLFFKSKMEPFYLELEKHGNFPRIKLQKTESGNIKIEIYQPFFLFDYIGEDYSTMSIDKLEQVVKEQFVINNESKKEEIQTKYSLLKDNIQSEPQVIYYAEYKNGLKHGKEIQLVKNDFNEEVWEFNSYVNGSLNGPCYVLNKNWIFSTKITNSQLLLVSKNYEDGKLHGNWMELEWDSMNKQLYFKTIIEYEKGLKHGFEGKFDVNRNPLVNGKAYLNGKEINTKEYEQLTGRKFEDLPRTKKIFIGEVENVRFQKDSNIL